MKSMQFTLPSAMRAILIGSVFVLAALAGRNQAWAQYDPGQSDLALNMSGTSTGADFGATFAMGVDGNRDGNFGDGSTFYENANPSSPPLFYQVDLGANEYINRIQFLPRTDATQNVFGNFNISIFPDNGSGQPAATPSYSQNFNSTYFGPSFATALPGLAAPGGANGRFVQITRLDNNYWLTFAEMEVVGSSTPLQNTLSNDIALGKPVTLDPGDSAGFGATNASGNDGDINGDFSAPNQGTTGNTGAPVFHSNNHGGINSVYWQVDLGADKPLTYANLMARMGVNTTSEFAVEVYDHNMNLVDTKVVTNSDVNGTTPGYDHAVDLTGDTGEFIRVTVGPDIADSFLSFSELQAFESYLPGDFNRDGHVTAADILAMETALTDLPDYETAKGLDASQLLLIGDVNGDGKFDNADLQALLSDLANSGGGGSVAVVPEPSTIVLAALGVLGLVVVGRRLKNNHLLPSPPMPRPY
jgi:Dockerin type I domain/PEP-CTERM motif